MPYSKIIGTGSALPERVMTNIELESYVNTNDKWIRERTGIQQRHISGDNNSSAMLATVSARKAITAAKIDVESIDLIIVATTTPDKIFPSTACLLQQELGNHHAPAFDIQAVCTGFLYALDIADKFISSGQAKYALVVGTDTLSKIIDWSDRGTCILFGDGAGAVVLKAADTPGIRSIHLCADGAYSDLLKVEKRLGKVLDNKEQRMGYYIHMQGREIFKLAVKQLIESIEQTLAINNISNTDIDWLVPHQANIRIIQAIAKKLKLPMEKVVLTIAEHGNTSAASIPLALDNAVSARSIQSGDTLVFAAFGAGITWGSALINY